MITDREIRMLRILISGRARRLSPYRIHKASSAESILRYCLRKTGFSKAWRKDELTGKQHLELLEAIREYGREWLRHDAEVFARNYLDYNHGRRGFPDRNSDRRSSWLHRGIDVFAVDRALSGSLRGHFSRFFGRAKQFVRELITAGAMAFSGPEPLTGEDMAEVDKQVQAQHQFFDKFHDELLQGGEPAPKPISEPGQIVLTPPPPMSPEQFIARVEQYGNSGFSAAQEIARSKAIRERIFTEERRVHAGTDEPCLTCQDQLAMNWQPIGSLLPIGASECRCHCHCSFRYRRPGDDREYIVPRRGEPIPALRPTADIIEE